MQIYDIIKAIGKSWSTIVVNTVMLAVCRDFEQSPSFCATTVITAELRTMSLFKHETHQEMRDPNVTSLYFAAPLAFNAPGGWVPLGRSP